MALHLSASNRFALLGSGRFALGSPLGASVVSPIYLGSRAGDITGLSGWWDAGALTDSVSGAGNAKSGTTVITAWNSTANILVDKSGNGNNLVPASGASGVPVSPTLVPRLSGSLGGISAWRQYPIGNCNIRPYMDIGFRLTATAARMDAAQAWTRYLVWSRPNLAQDYANNLSTGARGRAYTGTNSLIAHGSEQVVTISNAGTADILTVCGTPISTPTLAERHTASIVLVNTPGAGISVWLNDQQIATGIANTIVTASAVPTFLLGSGCYFHEAASWQRALSGADLVTLISSASSVTKRWARGARPGNFILLVGQSNAVTMGTDASVSMAETLRYYLGAVHAAVLPNAIPSPTQGNAFSSANGTSMYGGTGGFFLRQVGVSPTSWALGALGTAICAAYPETLRSEDLAAIRAVVIHWNESEESVPSVDTAVHAAEYKNAAREMLVRIRAAFGKTADQLPCFWSRGIPYYGGAYSTKVFPQTHRVIIDQLVGETGNNLTCDLPQCSDAHDVYMPAQAADGSWVGMATAGFSHADATSNNMWGRRRMTLVANKLLATASAVGATDLVAKTLPGSGIPLTGGPSVTAAQYNSSDHTILVTIQHDAGDDLIVDKQALLGIGWGVLTSGDLFTPGPVILATACARVDSTHLLVTLASAVSTPSTAKLFYCWGGAAISAGNAVTDNYNTKTKPSGWDAGLELGAAWGFNWPLQTGTVGTPLT